MKHILIALGLSLAGFGANADVISAGPGGFVVEHERVIDVGRGRVWQAAIDEVGQW